MAAISKCPNCQEPISIPLGVEVSASVRCPLCGAEYSLGVAMAMAPPELIPLPSSMVEPAAATEPAAASNDSTVAVQEDEAAAVVAQFVAVPLSAQLRAHAPKSPWRTLIEVVTGGLAGCLVAYYALAVWFGPQFPNVMPRLPLPLIERLTAPPKGEDAKEPVAPASKKPLKTKTTKDNKPAEANPSDNSSDKPKDEAAKPAAGATKPGSPPPSQQNRSMLGPTRGAKIIATIHR